MMVNVCLQCGDAGFSVALIHCHGCKLHLIHRYCLHPFPGFDDFVLWFCEDCEPKFIRLSKSNSKLPIVVKGGDYAILQKVPVKKRKRRVKRQLWSNTKRKSQKKEKAASPSTKLDVRTLDVEPPIQKDESRSPVENDVDAETCVGDTKQEQEASTRGRKRASKAKGKGQKKRVKAEDAIIEAVISDITHLEAVISDITHLEADCSEVGEQDEEEEAAVKQAEPLPSGDPQVVLCETPLQILVGEGMETVNVLEENSPNKAEHNSSPKDQPAGTDASAVLLYDVCALPIKDPSWRGSLSIFDRVFETSTRLVAHLSSLACARVTEATKALPELLSTDLFPRLDIWPKGFQKCRPSGNSIALYFFHDRECDEKIFDKLVKRMVDQDLGIKSVLEEAELLIFTSTVLPMEYWRFQEKVYLWGVFRGKQQPSPSVAAIVASASSSDEKRHAQNTQSPVSPLNNGSD